VDENPGLELDARVLRAAVEKFQTMASLPVTGTGLILAFLGLYSVSVNSISAVSPRRPGAFLNFLMLRDTCTCSLPVGLLLISIMY